MSEDQIAIVTGAGTGVGRATAIALAKRGWKVAILGRTQATLDETAALCAAGGRVVAHVVDVGRNDQVERAVAAVSAQWGRIDVLVCAAGTNTPQRSIAAVSLEKYHELVDANLHGSFYAARAVLPGMRNRRRGLIVTVVSIAGKKASALSGVGYVVSKFGQGGLTQAINAEENANGIRACAVYPGDIDTPILLKRPNMPPPEARANMLTADDVAACVMLAVDLPERAVIDEIVVRPRI
ncbi:MAG: SDR family NAD(P)-dependent oxidoreductase [Planctomycetes bacterium]|nr:SDR family NAD(P)-dependent oxidoreductase [Planctomycetota bacterium]